MLCFPIRTAASPNKDGRVSVDNNVIHDLDSLDRPRLLIGNTASPNKEGRASVDNNLIRDLDCLHPARRGRVCRDNRDATSRLVASLQRYI